MQIPFKPKHFHFLAKGIAMEAAFAASFCDIAFGPGLLNVKSSQTREFCDERSPGAPYLRAPKTIKEVKHSKKHASRLPLVTVLLGLPLVCRAEERQNRFEERMGLLKILRLVSLAATVAVSSLSIAQSPAPAKKHLLILGEEKGYRHESVSHAMAVLERLGKDNGLWDTTIRTDTEVLTKKKLEYNAKNLNSFDAVLFYTGGDLEMDAQQRADLLSFVHDDGKAFVGVHSAAITWAKWPEFVDMLGGTFDEHPWMTFNAPIIVEDPTFPGMQQWPRSFVLRDEIYQMKDFSREKVRVLMRLDPCKLDLSNPKVHRKDRDFAVTWAKAYGKGRVYYSTLGHPEENWDDPRLQQMYVGAIKWALGIETADVTTLPAATTSAGKEGCTE